MKICYLASAGSIHVQKLVKHFKKRHEVSIITYDNKKVEDVNLFQLDAHARYRPLNELLFPVHSIRIRELIRKQIKPDILHGHFLTFYGPYAALSGWHPVINSAWGSDILSSRYNPLYQVILRFVIRHSDFIISLSYALKRALLELGGIPEKIKYIPIGVDIERFRKSKKKPKNLLEKLGIGCEDEVVISTRYLKPIYGIENLIKAIPLVLSERPKAKFVILGDGPLEAKLKTMTMILGVKEAVSFVGQVRHENVQEYLNLADIYVTTSLSDGTSFSLLEAMACKLPVIVTDIEANRTWVKDGKTGLLFRRRNSKDLAEKIVYLLGDKDLRKRMGEKNREIIVDKACLEKNIEEIEKIYQMAIERK